MCTNPRTRSARGRGWTAALATVAVLAAGVAAAAPAGGNIDDRYRATSGPVSTGAEAEEALLTGHDDLILLRPTKLFTVHGAITGLSTTNAFLSPDATRRDALGVAQLGLQIGTRIASKVEVYADLSLVAARYRRYGELDYSAVTAALGARTTWHGVVLSATYQPSVIFNRDFSVRQLTQHRVVISAAAAVRTRGFTIEPSVSIERVWADPSDFTNWAAGAQIAISHEVPGLPRVSVFAAGAYERRAYDAYFPGLLGVARQDKRLQGALGVQWQATPRIAVVAQYSRQQNWSTSDVNGYRASSGSIGLSARARF